MIRVGKNAQDNWKLLDEANNQDYWFHLKSFPSPHVICNDISLLYECASECKRNSKYKNFGKIKVSYTQVNNIVKGESVGSVNFKSSRKVKYIVV